MGNPNFMNMNLNPQQIAALQQMQQAGNPSAFQNNMRVQIQHRQTALYRQNVPQLAARYGGIQNIPHEMHETFKRQCFAKATEQVRAMMSQHHQQQQQQQQQAQQQQQQGNMQNMQNMPNMQNMGGMQGM